MIQTPSFVIAFTTFPADGDATSLAQRLIDERLAACVNILPAMQSIYRWEGNVEQASEHQLIIKTTAARVDDLKKRIVALHPYDVPEVLVVPVSSGSEEYLLWIHDSVGTPSS